MTSLQGAASRVLASADADALKSALATAWKVPESALQWLVVETVSQSARQAEGAYVDIRAKAKPGRTKQAVQQACAETAEALRQAGFRDSVVFRVELYEPSLQHAHFFAGLAERPRGKL